MTSTQTPTWNAVDDYLGGLLMPEDAVLDRALSRAAEAGLPAISVSPLQGKFLYVLARSLRARRVLEVGTLAGYSTVWLARAVGPQGSVVTLEVDPHHAEVANVTFAEAGVSDRVALRLGAALDTLPRLKQEGVEPFDLVFIDADKANNAEYFDWALQLTRPGSVIVVDNVIRTGAVVDAASSAPDVVGTRRFHERMAAESRVVGTAIQTVGAKGWTGFSIALVTE
jgi:predicted O-methyltransferase YrrM